MPPLKVVRFADEEEQIDSPEIDFTIPLPSDNTVHIVVPSPLHSSFTSTPSNATVAFTDYDSEYIPTPSTASSHTLLNSPFTPPPRSPGSFASTPSPQPFTPKAAPRALPLRVPIHPALNFPNPEIALDFSSPPSLQVETADLAKPATPSIPKAIEIYCEGYPWNIVVQPLPGTVFVTVTDVLERIYESMHKAVTDEEYERSRRRVGDKVMEAVILSWRKRDQTGKQRMKRIDFLLGRDTFSGLELLDPERNRWRLHVGD